MRFLLCKKVSSTDPFFVFLLPKESSPSVAADQRSLSQPRLTVGSPDHRISRKLSPVEIYYEMRTRRNSVTSSVRYLSENDPLLQTVQPEEKCQRVYKGYYRYLKQK